MTELQAVDEPLFIILGASGTGKTTIAAHLISLLPICAVFDTDLLAYGYPATEINWQQIKNNWLRIAYQLAQGKRSTVLCGMIDPDDVHQCDHHQAFRQIYYLALTCDDEQLIDRLQSRGGWDATEECIDLHVGLNRQLKTQFPTIDTTQSSPEETARQIAMWIKSKMLNCS